MGWTRLASEYVDLDESARLKALQALSQQSAFSQRELHLMAKISGSVSRPSSGNASSPQAVRDASGVPLKLTKAHAKQPKNESSSPLRSRIREKDLLGQVIAGKTGTLHPEEMVLRVIGELWAKKLVEDHQMDTRGKPRMHLRQFTSEFFLRQYGVRGVALKAVADFVHSVRHYLSRGAAERARLENRSRLALFNSMCALDERSHSWRAKKVNFLLFFVQAVVGVIHLLLQRRAHRLAAQGLRPSSLSCSSRARVPSRRRSTRCTCRRARSTRRCTTATTTATGWAGTLTAASSA